MAKDASFIVIYLNNRSVGVANGGLNEAVAQVGADDALPGPHYMMPLDPYDRWPIHSGARYRERGDIGRTKRRTWRWTMGLSSDDMEITPEVA